MYPLHHSLQHLWSHLLLLSLALLSIHTPCFLWIARYIFDRTFALAAPAAWNVLHPIIYKFCSHTSPVLCPNSTLSLKLPLKSLFTLLSLNTPLQFTCFKLFITVYHTFNLPKCVLSDSSQNIKPQRKRFICIASCCIPRNNNR